MGIRGLTRLLRERCVEGVVGYTSPPYSGSTTTVAVDASIFMHAYRAIYRRPEIGLARQIRFYRNHGIAPVYVWDGNRVVGKLGWQPWRGRCRWQASRDLLDRLGIASVQASGEADPVIADLAERGIVDHVHSSDSDMIARGCPTLVTSYRGISTVYHLPTILRELDWTHSQLVDNCLLLGCDYHGYRLPRSQYHLLERREKDLGPLAQYRSFLTNRERVEVKPTVLDGITDTMLGL